MDIIRKTKKGFKKSLMEDIKIFQKKKKTKSKNMVVNDIKIFLKKKRISSIKQLITIKS